MSIFESGSLLCGVAPNSKVSTVAADLVYTLDIGTPVAKQVGYQFSVGCSIAFAIMHGVTIAQGTVDAKDLSAVTANLLCGCTKSLSIV